VVLNYVQEQLYFYLTPWSRGPHEKLIVAKLVKKLTFHGPTGALPCSQEPSTGPYTEPDKLSIHYPTLIL